MSVVDPAHLEERTAWPEAANNNENTDQDTDGDHCDAGDHYIPANIQHNTNRLHIVWFTVDGYHRGDSFVTVTIDCNMRRCDCNWRWY